MLQGTLWLCLIQRPSYWRQANRLLVSTTFFLCPSIFFSCYMIHHIFVKKRKLRQQNRKRGQSHREEHTDSSNCRSCLSGQKAHWTCFTFLPKLPDFGSLIPRTTYKRDCASKFQRRKDKQQPQSHFCRCLLLPTRTWKTLYIWKTITSHDLAEVLTYIPDQLNENSHPNFSVCA